MTSLPARIFWINDRITFAHEVAPDNCLTFIFYTFQFLRETADRRVGEGFPVAVLAKEIALSVGASFKAVEISQGRQEGIVALGAGDRQHPVDQLGEVLLERAALAGRRADIHGAQAVARRQPLVFAGDPVAAQVAAPRR